MALQIPFLDAHPSVQQALDFIAQRFPLGKRDLANEVLNGYLKLFTQADVKLKYGTVADVFAGNAAANADRTWQPVAADLGLTTIAYAVLSLEGFASVDLFVRQQVPTTPKITIHNGATAQQFNGYYLALGT